MAQFTSDAAIAALQDERYAKAGANLTNGNGSYEDGDKITITSQVAELRTVTGTDGAADTHYLALRGKNQKGEDVFISLGTMTRTTGYLPKEAAPKAGNKPAGLEIPYDKELLKKCVTRFSWKPEKRKLLMMSPTEGYGFNGTLNLTVKKVPGYIFAQEQGGSNRRFTCKGSDGKEKLVTTFVVD